MERKPVYSCQGPACWESKLDLERRPGPGLFEFLTDASIISYNPSKPTIRYMAETIAKYWGIKPGQPFITAPCDGVIRDPIVRWKDIVVTYTEAHFMAQAKLEQELKMMYSNDMLERFKLQHQINQLSCQENM